MVYEHTECYVTGIPSMRGYGLDSNRSSTVALSAWLWRCAQLGRLEGPTLERFACSVGELCGAGQTLRSFYATRDPTVLSSTGMPTGTEVLRPG